jgi:hypothetical protein
MPNLWSARGDSVRGRLRLPNVLPSQLPLYSAKHAGSRNYPGSAPSGAGLAVMGACLSYSRVVRRA